MKTKPIQVRVSPSEKKSFQDAADIVGVSLSAWIRSNLRKAATRDLEAVGKQAEFLKDGDS
ncbi:MAG: hypothetical protein HF978_03430 [Desulfobacteraceae bacterium]|nr:hypothetical protein [Desulfobacteraceae bacterium]MBC2754577.1 hypothetical protein [Desulfobacteraceae bacterium]